MEIPWMLCLFTIATIIIFLTSLAEGADCNNTRIINIAVIFYEGVYTGEDWPATFPKDRYARSEWLPIQATGGACFSLRTKLHHIPLHNISYVYSERELHSIRQFDVLMGPYSRLVENLAVSERKVYLITSPVDLSFESRVVGSRDTRFLIPIWPTWSDFLKLIKEYLSHIRAEEKVTRIHIVYGGTSDNTIQVAHRLHSMLSAGAMFDYVGISYFTRYDPREPIDQARGGLLEQHNPVMMEALLISYVIENAEADLVIGCFDTELLTPLMKLFGEKHVDLDRSTLKWFIADMTYTVSWERFSDLKFDYSEVRAPSFSRAKYGKGVNKLAAADSLLAINKALENIGTAEPTSSDIADAIRGVNISEVQIGGRMEYDENSFRKGYNVSVLNLCENSLCSKPQGTWKSNGRDSQGEYHHEGSHVAETSKVVAVLEHPFVSMKKDRTSSLKGNQRFEGIVVDILREVAIILLRQGKLFEYEIYPVPDGKYGMRYPNGTWDGVFKEIEDGNAVLALGMISKTKERLSEFTFSPGFAFTGITFIVHKRELTNVYFQFLRPFENKVWGYLIVTWFVSSLLIYGFHKWDPFKDNLPAKKKRKKSVVPDEDAPNYIDDRFARDERYNMKESFWYSYLTLAQLGTHFAAYSYPIRTYTVFYWFFALIVVACYTGNLASFLTESIYFHPHLSIKELLSEGYGFGWMKSTSIDKFFVDSPIWEYQEMNRELKKRKTYARSYEHGLSMVKKDTNFVFVATHLLLSFHEGLDENCTLYVSPERLDITELAFPLSSDWNLMEEFAAAIMELREGGHIRSIFNKWLKYSSKCNIEEDEDDDSISLDITNFIGLYAVLAFAILMSGVMLVIKIRYGHLSFFAFLRHVLDRRTSA